MELGKPIEVIVRNSIRNSIWRVIHEATYDIVTHNKYVETNLLLNDTVNDSIWVIVFILDKN